MKSCFTTVAKISLSLLITLLSLNLVAQEGINVPNSIFGLGDPMGSGYTIARSLAGAQTAVLQADYVNVQNPAANAFLASPAFDVALQMRNHRYNGPNYSGTQSNVSIRHFALGFANAKKLGVSFGLSPFTRVECALSESGSLPETGEFFNSYQGDGGINKVNGNISYRFYEDSLTNLSFGIGANYYFGFIERSAITQISNAGTFNSRTAENLLFGDFGAQAGFIYRRILSKKLIMNAGVAYEYAGNVRTSRELSSIRFTGVYSGEGSNILDTLINTIDTGSSTIPATQRAGLALEVNKKWYFSLNYEQTNWSDLSVFNNEQGLSNRVMFALGAEFWPDYRASNDLFQFMRYRAGARIGQSHITDQGQAVDEFGISLGLGIPMLKSGSLSSLNIGWEFAQRNLPVSGLTESISRINFGIIMTPNKFDRWFYRRKID